MIITPLDNWIYMKTGAREARALHAYQLEKLRETLDYVKKNSRFYSNHLSELEPDSIKSFDDISIIPFTTAEMLSEDPLGFLCVPPGDIGRIVTLPTSGTAGSPKRIFFTQEDQELTLGFFHHGMTTLASENDRVMIYLPGESENGVGDLLKRGLARFGCEGIVYGPIGDYDDAYRALASSGAACAVGLPAQLLALSRIGPEIKLKSVLLCSDYISQAVTLALKSAWDCEVFGHYGMTESGLGGGVECSAHAGYHLREDDLFFEIIDPISGTHVPDGEYGEAVFTTLTRQGMPLIRYKTGDHSRITSETCPCGSGLRRLGRAVDRISDTVEMNGFKLSMPMLDEILFAIPGLAGFSAEIINNGKNDALVLTIYAPDSGQAMCELDERIKSDEQLGACIDEKLFALELRHGGTEVLTYGNTKRCIADKRMC